MTFNLSETKNDLSNVLDMAAHENVVVVREDGSRFQILPIAEKVPQKRSLKNIKGVKVNLTDEELDEILREGRGGRIF
ncbi:MAG: hypothetical protein FWB85_05625 [Chitinispirillia bacterium]|nr:hypothetical protein [Chitinispirillia bacterium]MCL2241696.1 hypothetical protein [Chitinispirillia bacterium]